MQRTQIYLPPEKHRVLLQEAAKQGISFAELMRRIVSEHLERQTTTPKVSREAYLHIVGIGASGRPDVADRHDYYLAEALKDEHNG